MYEKANKTAATEKKPEAKIGDQWRVSSVFPEKSSTAIRYMPISKEITENILVTLNFLALIIATSMATNTAKRMKSGKAL